MIDTSLDGSFHPRSNDSVELAIRRAKYKQWLQTELRAVPGVAQIYGVRWEQRFGHDRHGSLVKRQRPPRAYVIMKLYEKHTLRLSPLSRPAC